MALHIPLDQADNDLAVLLSDPVFVERTLTSDPFLDWNLDLAIHAIHLSREEAARIFLQLHPHYILELRDTLPTPLPPLAPNLPDLWRSFVNSDWRWSNEHEPKIAGYSVLRQMLVQQPDPTDAQPLWVCGVPSPSRPNAMCGQDFRRWDRAITHIRGKHLNHRPYPCDGECGVQTCTKRFTSQENMHQHCNPQIERCECGKAELRQNMLRHKRHCPAQYKYDQP